MAVEYKGSSPAKDKMLLVGHLGCTVDHLLEASISLPFQADDYLEMAKLVDEKRVEVMKTLDIPEQLWCVYKHLAIARVLSQELFKTGEVPTEEYVISLNEILVGLFGEDYEACATCRDDKGADNAEE